MSALKPNIWVADNWRDYEVLDAGDGEKLERWGEVILRRPDPQVIWPKANPVQWRTAHAVYHRSEQGGGQWECFRKLPDKWTLKYGDLSFVVRPTGFKHTGLFPEQAVNWDWMRTQIRGKSANILNLFAYTGGASMACAMEGASVCHVDAAKSMISWAQDNRLASKLPEDRFRFIAEDAAKFVAREIRRGHTYEGIIMDPPSYGRGPGGEMWRIEQDIYPLIELCAKVLSDKPLFLLINSYTTGLQPLVLQNMLMRALPGGHAEAREVCLPITSGGHLPCGATGRWVP